MARVSPYLVLAFLLPVVCASINSIVPDTEGLCQKYKISCPLGKICQVRKIHWPRKLHYPICTLRNTPPAHRHACKLPPAPGKCSGRYLRWYYNTQAGQCSFFYFSGCDRNDNNFRRREDCEKTCLGLLELVVPPEATVLPPIDPLAGPTAVPPRSLARPNHRKRQRGRKGKDGKRKGRKGRKKGRKGRKRNRDPNSPQLLSLKGNKVSYIAAQKDAPTITRSQRRLQRKSVLPTSLRKSFSSGKYFKLFTILSRRHGNNVYRKSHRKRKQRNRGRTTLPPTTVAIPPTSSRTYV